VELDVLCRAWLLEVLGDACDAAGRCHCLQDTLSLALPERDVQKVDGRNIALGHGLSNP